MNKNKSKNQKLLFYFVSYIFIFVGISFILTCSIILFLHDSPLTEEFIRSRAPRTFSNVFILSFIFTCIAMSVKYCFFDKHVSAIRKATDEISKGNYSYKI